MKKLLVLLLVLPFFATAQGPATAEQSTKPRKWLIGVAGSLDYSYRTLKSSSDAAWIVDGRNNLEIPKLGYTVGANVSRQISGKLRLNVGLNYANHGYRTKEREQIAQPMYGIFETTKGYLAYQYNYLELPISVSYRIVRKGAFILHASAGIMPGLLLSVVNKSHLSTNDGPMRVTSTKDQSDFSRFALAPIAALGLEYALSPRSILSLTPTFRYSLTKSIDAPIEQYLWSAGLCIGYSRRF
jgi:hypothetical protein